MSTYIKIENEWTPINKVFKKINGEWVQQNDIISALGDMIYFYGGNTISKLLYIIFNQQQYTGKSFLLTSTYDGNQVYPSWSIVSGSQYVTINSNGKVTINEGVTNETIEFQASYNGETDNKTITVSYDNQLTIESADTITGTSGNVIARYNSTVVTPTWSITSGNQYATIDSNGEITITSSGTITVSASYDNYTASKDITLVYDNSTTTEVEVNPDGSTTTTVTITTENQDGTTTETSVVTTVNEDGSSSNTESETTTNLDGSSETTSTTTNSDGSSSESTTTVSAPDQNGTTVSNTNTTNYDENGDLTGSSQNQTTNNSDGSSESTTTNYNADGDPTSQINNEVDTSGNSSTQDIEYDSNGDPVVTCYTIDTSNNEDGTKEFNETGVNTEFYGFDATQGFQLHIHFTIDFTQQPANQNEGHHNVLTMKRATPSPWYGFQLRHSSSNRYVTLGTQFSSGSNTNTNITPSWITANKLGEYDLTITYDPTKATQSFICRNNLTNSNVYTSNNKFPDIQELRYLTICIGYAQDADGNAYRYSNIDVIDFSVTKLTS